MHAASNLSRRLIAVDAHYKSLVYCLADIMKDGKMNRAMLMDAVLLAEELEESRVFENAVRNPPIDPKQTVVIPNHDYGRFT